MYSNKPLILVAEGTATDHETILQALKDEFQVIPIQTTADALTYVHDDVALVICNLESSQVHSMELIRQWKLHQPRTPFLALTDGHNAGAVIDAMKSGVADCLVRPVDQDDLRSSAMHLAREGKQLGSSTSSTRKESVNGNQRSHINIPPDTSLEDLERAAVEQALFQHHGNRTHAARTLGISVRTLQRKLKAWGMPIISFPSTVSRSGFLISAQSNAPHIFGSHVH